MGYLSTGFVLTTLAVNSLIYSGESADQAASAGFILLSMVVVSSETPEWVATANAVRPCGYSISDRALRPRIAASLIPSLSKRRTPGPIGIAAPCRLALALERRRHRPPKCIRQPTLTALRRRLRFLDSREVPLARRTAARLYHVSEIRRGEMPAGPMRRGRFHSQPSIPIGPRPSTRTTPTRKTPTRSASASTRYWKCQMSVEGGGRPGKQPETRALLRRII